MDLQRIYWKTLIKFMLLLLCFFSATVVSPVHAEDPPHQVLEVLTTADEKESMSPLKLQLIEQNGQMHVLIAFDGKDVKPDDGMIEAVEPGGEYLLFFDQVLLKHDVFSEQAWQVDERLQTGPLESGVHLLRCEVHHSYGKSFIADLKFNFKGSPTVSIEQEKPQGGIIDPEITLGFSGSDMDRVGILEVFIDEQLHRTSTVNADDNHTTKPLSKWIEQTINIAAFAQGEHLLSFRAQGVNGESTTLHSSFTVDNTPRLEVEEDDNGETVYTATFTPAEDGYAGSVNIFYQQGVILSKQTQEATVKITRSEILQVLSQDKIPIPAEIISVVIGLRSANNAEKWQQLVLR